MNPLLLPLLLLGLVSRGVSFEYANFPLIETGLKTGEHKAIQGETTNQSDSFVQPFFNNRTASPTVALGLIVMEMTLGSTSVLSYTVTVSAITRTDFRSTIAVASGTIIYKLTYTYLAIDQSLFGNFIYYQLTDGVSGFTAVTNGKHDSQFSTTGLNSRDFVVSTFLKDCTLVKSSTDLSIRVTASISSSTTITSTLWTNSTVRSASYYVYYFNRAQFELTRISFLDFGSIYGQDSITTVDFTQLSIPLTMLNYYNLMRGINWLAFNPTTTADYFHVNIASFPVSTIRGYKFLSADYLHWRQRTPCSAATNFYIQQEYKCYSGCQPGYAANSTIPSFSYCEKCDISCQTCSSLDGRLCVTCNASDNRVQNGSECVCAPGHFDVGQARCSQCPASCASCECYDGNLASGDGCSSECRVQTNFVCQKTVPSICVYQNNYSIRLLSLLKRETSNIMDLVFGIMPMPPVGTLASLSDLPVTILSQSLANNQLTLEVLYSESITLGSLARLSLSTLPNSLQFAVQPDNNLLLNYYPEQSYTLYTAQIVLLWVFIGLSWCGCLVYVVLHKRSLLYIVEYMMSVGVVAIGGSVRQKLSLYFVPIDAQLRYIFGYNLAIQGEDGMLVVINYGLIINVLPALIFVLMIALRRVNVRFLMDQFVKKYILLELTYALLCFNAVLVIYGLATQQKTRSYSTALSIASIVVGVVYLSVLAMSSYIFVTRQPAFKYYKAQMFQAKGPRFHALLYVWLKLVCLLAYCLCSLSYPSLIQLPLLMVCLNGLTIVLVFLFKPYYNNLRVVFNELLCMLAYLCYYLILVVPTAEWSGFVVVVLLYVQMTGNYGLMGWNLWQSRKNKVKDTEAQLTSQRSDTASVQSSRHAGQFNSRGEMLDLDFDPRQVTASRGQQEQEQLAQLYESRMETLRKRENVVNPYSTVERTAVRSQLGTSRHVDQHVGTLGESA